MNSRENGPAGKPHDRVHAGRRLRELADVLDLLVEDVDARRDRAIEEERLGEADLVVLGAVALLRRHAERLAAAEEVRRLERELAEEALVLRDAGAERDLVAVLLLELQPDVDLVASASGVFWTSIASPFERLEVAELIQPLDAVLQRLGVEHAALDQPHLAPDDVVARRRVADEGDAVDEVLLAFLEPHRHVDDRRRSLAVLTGRGGAAGGRRQRAAAAGAADRRRRSAPSPSAGLRIVGERQ